MDLMMGNPESEPLFGAMDAAKLNSEFQPSTLTLGDPTHYSGSVDEDLSTSDQEDEPSLMQMHNSFMISKGNFPQQTRLYVQPSHFSSTTALHQLHPLSFPPLHGYNNNNNNNNGGNSMNNNANNNNNNNTKVEGQPNEFHVEEVNKENDKSASSGNSSSTAVNIGASHNISGDIKTFSYFDLPPGVQFSDFANLDEQNPHHGSSLIDPNNPNLSLFHPQNPNTMNMNNNNPNSGSLVDSIPVNSGFYMQNDESLANQNEQGALIGDSGPYFKACKGREKLLEEFADFIYEGDKSYESCKGFTSSNRSEFCMSCRRLKRILVNRKTRFNKNPTSQHVAKKFLTPLREQKKNQHLHEEIKTLRKKIAGAKKRLEKMQSLARNDTNDNNSSLMNQPEELEKMIGQVLEELT